MRKKEKEMTKANLIIENQEIAIQTKPQLFNSKIIEQRIVDFEKKATLIEPMILSAKSFIDSFEENEDAFLENTTDEEIQEIIESLKPQKALKEELDDEIKKTNKMFNEVRDRLTKKKTGKLIQIMDQHHLEDLTTLTSTLTTLQNRMLDRRKENNWEIVNAYLQENFSDVQNLKDIQKIDATFSLSELFRAKSEKIVSANKKWKLTKGKKAEIDKTVDLLISELSMLLKFESQLPNERLKEALNLYRQSGIADAMEKLNHDLEMTKEIIQQAELKCEEENLMLKSEIEKEKAKNISMKKEMMPESAQENPLNLFALHEQELQRLRQTDQLENLTKTKLNLLYNIMNDVAMNKSSKYYECVHNDNQQFLNALIRLIQQ